MSNISDDLPEARARAEVVGRKITGVFFLHDFVEIHMGDMILTGLTEPFGGPESVRLVRLARPELGVEKAIWIW